MVGVALLPLVAFAVLAVFELDTIAKSTANATESAILQRQQVLLDREIDHSAGQFDSGMADIDAAVQDWLALSPKPKAASQRAQPSPPRPTARSAPTTGR